MSLRKDENRRRTKWNRVPVDSTTVFNRGFGYKSPYSRSPFFGYIAWYFFNDDSSLMILNISTTTKNSCILMVKKIPINLKSVN